MKGKILLVGDDGPRPYRAGMFTALAAAMIGGKYLNTEASIEPRKLTEADVERLRKAEERRQRRAARRAKLTHKQTP